MSDPSIDPTASADAVLKDPAFLEPLRQQMVAFATLQLSDRHLAEDAVQEALIGALKNAKAFGGKAALKTWVFAILKNKIADLLRTKSRMVNASSLLREDEDEDALAALFDERGHWTKEDRPEHWDRPEHAMQQQQFWRVFEACLERLPPQQARIFMMREFVELESEEICQTVGISVNHLFVMLHRSRLRLRECLENKWFSEGATP
jgi:RNA polymerase sigma-70 factor (ECF subfamily)